MRKVGQSFRVTEITQNQSGVVVTIVGDLPIWVPASPYMSGRVQLHYPNHERVPFGVGEEVDVAVLGEGFAVGDEGMEA